MIRLKVFIPALLLSVLVALWMIYRLDGWLKSSIESAISAVTGTKTEISSLQLSLRESRLFVGKLKVASPEHEFKNLVEFSEIVIDFQTLPLFEKRFVVDEFSLKGIDWNTPRKESGFLLAKERPKDTGIFSGFVDQAMTTLSEEFEKMPVAELIDFRVPESPKELLSQLNLESEKAFKEAAIQVELKQGEWRQRVSSLKDLSEFQARVSEIKKRASDPGDRPQDLLKTLEEVKKGLDWIREAKEQTAELIEASRKDFAALESLYGTANASIEADFKRARDMVSLDQFSVQNLSRLLFGPSLLSYYGTALKMQARLNDLQQIVKSEEKQVEVKERARGRDIVFVSPQRQPGFVLAKSDFSVEGLEKSAAARLSQQYELKLRDLSSDPALNAKPMQVVAEGRFRNAPLSRAQIDLLWDYTQQPVKNRYLGKAERVQVSSWQVGIPKVFPLVLEKAMAEISTELEWRGGDLDWKSRMQFREVEWNFKTVPRIGFIGRAMSDVFQGVKGFWLELRLTRNQDRLLLELRSDLDESLGQAISLQIEERLQAFRLKLQKEIGGMVEEYQRKMLREIQSFKNEVLSPVEKRLETLQAYEAEVKSRISSIESRAKGGVQKGIQEKLAKPIKSLKIPGF
jgi:uncharacterized protein (TIGR03545 family)